MVAPAARRQAAAHLQITLGLSQRRAGRLIGISNSSLKYQSSKPDDAPMRQRLKALTAERPRFGYRRLGVLLEREGTKVNHKRLHRLYRGEGLGLRKRRRQRAASVTRLPLTVPGQAGERFLMDFVSDSLASGRSSRTLNIVDDYTRECLAIEVYTSLTGERVARILQRLLNGDKRPQMIVVDNGPEFTSKALDAWATKNKVHLRFIDPGRPMQNAFIESFNGRFRDECLNQHWFISLEEAREEIEKWREDYNQQRPHSSLRQQTPAEFARRCAQSEEAKIKLGPSL